MKFRSPHNQLPLQFKLNHGNRLMHLHIKAQILCIIIRIVLNHKTAAVRIRIRIHGKGCQRDQVNSIPVLQRIQIPVPCGHAKHVGNAGRLPACGAHPHNIVVAPLYVYGMVLA